MTVTTAIILGLTISFVIIYITLNIDKFKPKKEFEHQELIDKIHTRIAKANGASIDQFSLENSYENKKKKEDELYEKAHFINKNCENLDDFIINDEINEFDLRKLAELNEIELQISNAWYPLVIKLVKELYANDWNKKVSCIKEKYASLKFYTNDEYESNIYNIIEKYGKSSEHICETCGERGEIRHNSAWDYVACRKHYIENRGKIIIEDVGFNHNGVFYQWKDVKNIVLEDFDDYNKKYKFITIELNNKIVKHQGWEDEKVYVSKSNIGFGKFLNVLSADSFISKPFANKLDKNYLKYFENLEFCEVCGYKAVYFEECECCENKVWEKNLDRWEEQLKQYLKNEEKYKKRIQHYQEKINNKEQYKKEDISYSQIRWTIDEGEIYESKLKNYIKNPEYKILFTEEEYKEYLKDEDCY